MSLRETLSRPFDRLASPFTLARMRFAVFLALLFLLPKIGTTAAMGGVYATVCVLGALGLFTSASAWAVVALGLGFGEAGQPLLWAAALLGVAPCADVLAFDAVPDAWRRADAKSTAPPAPSPVYGAPLRAMEFAIALFYLARGPAAFGLLFAALLFVPRGRWLAFALGLAFEAYVWRGGGPRGVALLYLAFLDWAAGLRWLGRRLFTRPLAIVNDGDCGFCRRAVATLRTLDVFERIDWTASTETARVRALGLHEVADSGELTHFTAVFPGGTVWGYDAYLRLAKRIPLFWPMLPLLVLPPVVALGRRIYGKVEASRPDINPEPLVPRPPPTRLGMGIVGLAVVLAVLVAHL